MYAPGSMGGGWSGIYYYSSENEQELPPVAFMAQFTLPGEDGTFAGVITDDGPLGLADARGVQYGAQVRFQKLYRALPHRETPAPIRYDGTLSPDGSRITGTWELSVRRLFGLWTREAHGIWEADRMPTGELIQTDLPTKN